MTQNKRTKRRSPITAILAVLLILAGVAAIAGSLWMQENEINTGAELYDTLSEQLKLQPASEEDTEPQQDEAPAEDNAAAEDDSAEQDETEQEQPVIVIPEELSAEESPLQPDVTVVPPLTLQPVEQPAYQFDPTPEGNGGVSSGLTGANLAACKEANRDFAAWLKMPSMSALASSRDCCTSELPSSVMIPTSTITTARTERCGKRLATLSRRLPEICDQHFTENKKSLHPGR